MSARVRVLPEAPRLRYLQEAITVEADLRKTLAAPGSLDDEAIWFAYARTEKLIAVMKFRIGFETPGIYAELPDASDAPRILEEARALLAEGAEEISRNRPIEAIKTLRKARNNLRSYLARKARSSDRPRRRTRRKPNA